MTWWDGLSIAGFAIASFAAFMTVWNLRRLPRPPVVDTAGARASLPLSVCIPARNEAANIEACVRSVLGGGVEELRVYVYDDQSEDETPSILKQLTAEEPRLRIVPTQPMPSGWCGKQHACWRLAQAAIAGSGNDGWMLFIDADVRIAPNGLRRTLAHATECDRDGELGLLSTFPRQVTRSVGEALLVTSIFFILLSYLPFGRMRRTLDPAASAACGQFMLVKQSCYTAFGGHESLKDSMHDGVKMPRLARRHGYRTDLFDGPDVASCRMYKGFGAAWRGFAKNAYEGLGSPVLLLILTMLHFVGHILPPVLFAASITISTTSESVPWIAVVASGGATLLGIGQRLVIATREQHTAKVAPLHALGVLIMTAVQWWSLYLHLTGRRSWRGRTLQQVSPR
ncbi:MAG: glycosyltransferase [Phycisphaerales bacterium]